MLHTCLHCHKEILGFPSVIKKRKYCSFSCRILSPVWREKISTNAKKRTGAHNGRWKGGKLLRQDGYIMIYSPTHPKVMGSIPYVLEHRLLMERHLGRLLHSTEIIHHKNGNRHDNRIQNLELISQSDHAKHHLRQNPLTGQFSPHA